MPRPTKRARQVGDDSLHLGILRAAPKARNSLRIQTRKSSFLTANTVQASTSKPQVAPVFGKTDPQDFSFSFASELRDILDDIPVSHAPHDLSRDCAPHLAREERLLEEGSSSNYGPGQNEMSVDWLNAFSQMYLDTIMGDENIASASSC
ncbi:unnamed protein product, partial [Rhizoctonia solani]